MDTSFTKLLLLFLLQLLWHNNSEFHEEKIGLKYNNSKALNQKFNRIKLYTAITFTKFSFCRCPLSKNNSSMTKATYFN